MIQVFMIAWWCIISMTLGTPAFIGVVILWFLCYLPPLWVTRKESLLTWSQRRALKRAAKIMIQKELYFRFSKKSGDKEVTAEFGRAEDMNKEETA